MKRMIKASSEREYQFSDLSEVAKANALSQNDVVEYLEYLADLEVSEGLDSLKYSLDSVECRLTRGSFNRDINTRDYDIELTPRGEDFFCIAGLDESYQVKLPQAEGDGLYVGEIFVDVFRDGIKQVKAEVEAINLDILEYINSSEDAEDNIAWDYDDVPEVYAFNERLYNIGQEYIKVVKAAADAAVADLSSGIDRYLYPDTRDASYIFDDSAFVFDVDGNVI